MGSKLKGQNDIAWEALFERYDILNQIDMHNHFVISASKIKEFREPRLMAKFDHHINLPPIFANNQLAILPISRGDYIISHFEAYKSFETKSTFISNASLPSHIQSLDPNDIPSEAVAITAIVIINVFDELK